ncbi:DNA-processing protein DprA [uncultured Rubinisphaera sp.]|uniref:DNA-processing protein DprA n=1 Tax=uncultured Rubinisphaera sp. TaxID=1678686 RepID=UPI0030DC5E0E
MSETAEDHRLACIALNLVNGVGPRLQTTLLERFPNPYDIFKAPASQLMSVPGVGKKLLSTLDANNHRDMARRELEDCDREEISVITNRDVSYPAMLKQICDPPLVLYCRGRILASDQLAVAIVGSRNCTLYGRRMAEQFASGLARAGVTIISGLARGIDAVAHRAALQAGGRTIAVCASGLLKMYPPEHSNLALEIAQSGAVISESPLLRQPTRGLFPQRNRIVSGMSLGVIVIEASTTSGTLHTARHAMEQGREVFAVPGPLDSRESAGCHQLIRDGVQLVRGVDDVLQELGPLMEPVQVQKPVQKSTPVDRAQDSNVKSKDPPPIRVPRELNLSDQQSMILKLIDSTPILVDEIIERSGIEPSRVLSTLTILQMKKLIDRLPGNLVTRSKHV